MKSSESAPASSWCFGSCPSRRKFLVSTYVGIRTNQFFWEEMVQTPRVPIQRYCEIDWRLMASKTCHILFVEGALTEVVGSFMRNGLTVFMFHGPDAHLCWTLTADSPIGIANHCEIRQALIRAGFRIISETARLDRKDVSSVCSN